MADEPTADDPDRSSEPPPIPEGGGTTRLATKIASRGIDKGDDEGVRFAGLRLAALLGTLALIGLLNPWTLIVILALVVMITLHELGHFLTAKRAGMKCTEFFLGFGPKIWSVQKGETEYGIKAIPAGAYVKVIGMSNLDEVPAEDEARTYRQKTFGQRLSVAVAGSAMHFALALFLIFASLAFVGLPNGELGSPSTDRTAIVEEVFPGSGAESAGLQPGDEFVSIDGIDTPTVTELQDVIGPRKGTTVPVVVLRDGEQVAVDVDLKAFVAEGQATCGMGIDMQPAPIEKVAPLTALVQTPKEFVDITWLSMRGLASFFTPSGVADFAGQVGDAREDRDARDDPPPAPSEEDVCEQQAAAAAANGGNGTSTGGGGSGENRLLSIYGLVRIGGDVGEVDPSSLITLFALINIFIGVFNLVPLLPFDGGHVAIAVYEKIQEKRLGRRRYFTDVSRLLPLTYGVIIVLGMLFFSSIYLDIVNPVGT